MQLQQATSDTRQIVRIAKRLLTEIFKHGYSYQKCGVQLGHIHAASIPGQIDLFSVNEPNNSTELMNTIDKINNRFPKGITLSATGINTGWQVPVEYLSPHYTTNWNERAIARCN